MIEVLAFLEHWRPSQVDEPADGNSVPRAAPHLVQPPEPARQPLGLTAAMRHLVGAVSVVTAGVGHDRTGATVTSAHSLSVDPETMLVSINLSSSTWPVIERHGHFCVNILGADQIAIADRFAGRDGLKGKDRYEGAAWTTLVTGAQALQGALARALVSRPRFLALDEPLGALEARTRIDMQRFLERVWRDQAFTAVLVTHDVSEAVTLADRIVLIEDGRIGLDIRVPLARPRQRGTPEFGAIEAEILGRLLDRRP